ncbi:MAG: ABC transporter ATP-binding protein [Kiloniellales bacterium]
MAFLEVENVRAGYGNGPDILTGISIKIEQNQSYCIIGPNGAGKSTLLRAICGLLTPRHGRVTFKGETLNKLRPNDILRRGICFVPQDHAIFADMTVKENVRMGGYILKDRKEVDRRIEEVFDTFPILRQRSGQLAKTLSGGEQQMLVLGRTMVLRPEVVMLDEPSLGLAPKISKQIFDSMARLKFAGMTVVLVEQNARMGLDFAERGYVLDLGREAFEGPSQSVLADSRIQDLYLGRRHRRRKASPA